MARIRDRRGIEGLPLQLLIVAVVAGITAPAVYAGLDAYDRGQVDSRVRGELLRLTRAAQQYVLAGGGSETLRLDLRGGFLTPVDGVVIGDRADGPRRSVVGYRIDGDERLIVVEHPAVSMAGPDGAALTLAAGPVALHVEAIGDTIAVRVV